MDSSSAKQPKLGQGTWQDIESSQDLLSLVLSKLSANDLGVFRFVSAYWRNVISCPSLIEEHLSLSKQNPVFLIYPFVGDEIWVFLVDTNGTVLQALFIPGLEDLSALTLNCCHNGLLCLTNCPWEPDSNQTEVDLMDLEIRICNPCTHGMNLLPQGTCSKDKPEIGVAFGPSYSEYKVYRFYYSEPKFEGKEPLCEVYTPQSSAWRGIGKVPKCPMNSKNVFVNGSVFWFVPSEDDKRTAGSILTVDMDESFRVIELPDEVTAHAFLLDLDGCLCLVAIYDDDQIMDIWTLGYNDGREYWEKITSDYIPYSVIESTDSAAGIKNRIFLITTEHFFIYDIEEGVWCDLPFMSAFANLFPTVFTFTESLLPCNGAVRRGV